ncbi:hypothetical protein [Arenimonas composti]|nr:hypothetical protein [Arenimonas composti]
MRTVLILGARAPVALDLARRFAAAGWRVIAADSTACGLSARSRAVAATLALPPPREQPLAWAAALAAGVREYAVELVIPTCEEAFYLARYRERLPDDVRVVVADFATMRRLHSKVDFIATARETGALVGVDVPATRRVHSLAEARDWAGGEPLVLKPEFSRFGVHVRLYPRGLPKEAPALPEGAWAAQRFHAGRELCSYAVADHGVLRACSAYRPAWRLGDSASFHFAPVELPAIRAFTAAFVARQRYTGQIGFDWIQAADGRLAVIECNPRATSGLHLFAACDPLPATLAGDHDGPVLVPGHRRAAMLGAMMATAGLMQALRSGRAREWWRDWRSADDVITRAGDRGPLAGSLHDLLAWRRQAKARGVGLRAAATGDIEFNGEALPS